MKRSLQDQANDQALWEALKRKFKKSSTSNTSCMDDDIHSHHDDHQEDDAPPEGEKIVKRHKASKLSKSTRGSSSKHSAKDSITYVSKQQQQQEWDAWLEETVIDEDESPGNLKMSGNEDHHRQDCRFAAGGNGHDGRDPRDVEIERLRQR
nr:reverse transcriptase domain-containing protein [Tanacetum cinerariifolium]